MRSPLSSKLTYANVMSTIAVVLAVGGGATALALTLPKNSVHSKQIAKGAVKTSDIGKDAVTGDQVKESSLGKVPLAVHADSADSATTAASATNAAHAAVADSLGSLTQANTVQTQNVAGRFNSTLELEVKGFGRFWLRCITNSGSFEDDELSLNESNTPGEKAIESGFLAANEYALGPVDVFPIDAFMTEAGSREYGNEGRRLYLHMDAAILGSTKTMELSGGGFDDEGTAGCVGQLHASISG